MWRDDGCHLPVFRLFECKAFVSGPFGSVARLGTSAMGGAVPDVAFSFLELCRFHFFDEPSNPLVHHGCA